MEQSELIARLYDLRRTVRRRLVGYGVFAVLAGGMTGLLAIIALDWLVWLPPLLRAAGGILFVTGSLAATYYWVVKPLRLRLGLEEIASRLERHFGTLGDRLSSTVNFLKRDNAASPGMIEEVITRTERIVRDLPLESAVSSRQVGVRAGVFAMCLLVLVGAMFVAPTWVRTGVERYAYPFSDTEWPRRTSIVPLTSRQTVALGESITVRMRVDRGLHDSLRGVVHLRERDGRENVLAMQRQRDGTFYTTIDAVTDDLTYWFEAGDASTRRTPGTLRVVRRPEVVEALATIEPPPYAAGVAARVRDLADGPIRAPLGGFVTVAIRSSKPIPISPVQEGDGAGSPVGLLTEGGEFLEFDRTLDDPRRLTVRFELTGDVSFRIQLRDADGFENRGAASYSILATPDAPPSVAIVEPQAVTELTPKATVRVVVRVEDDFGITSLALQSEHAQLGTVTTTSLTDRLEIISYDGGVEAFAAYVWNMEPLSLAPGDVLVYEAVASDNHAAAGAAGQEGRSSALRIRVISETEFAIRIREDLSLTEARLRKVVLEQSELRDQTGELLRAGAALTGPEREVAAGLAVAQARLARQLRDAALRLDDLQSRMERNVVDDKDAHARVLSLAKTLRAVAAGPMTVAGGSLGSARDRADAAAQQADLQTAARAQDDAIERMQALIRSLLEWGSFESIVGRTRDLLDRQDRLHGETVELGRSMLGKSVDALTPEEAAALRRVQRRQKQLAGDVERHLMNLRQLREATGSRDTAAADAMDAALRAARAHDLQRRLTSASEAIEANRTAAAVIDQRAAAEGMREMIAALREREVWELEELRKRAERSEDQVARLIEQQESLRLASTEATTIGAADSMFLSLARDQHILARNTGLLGSELSEVERALDAGRLLRRAVTPMRRAESALQVTESDRADAAQDEALTLLQDALAALEELARAVADEQLRRSLARIHDKLDAMLAAQLSVNEGIDRLAKAIADRGRIGRSESRHASKLAREQAFVRDMVEVIRPQLEKVPVYDWALERVGRWMDSSRDALDARLVDEALMAMVDRVVRELEKLIGALIDTQSLPINTEFVEADGGGGGGGGASARGTIKPVPTVAELLVLKAMQVDINDRTQKLSAEFDPSEATEVQLQQLTIIGEDQTEVRRLAELVTERTRP